MKIFISYSRDDSAFALRLHDNLKRAGFDLWIDQGDIHMGNWDQQVAQALKESAAMIVILTPKSVASENVTDEWSDFLDQQKPIVPILHKSCEVPFRLKRKQWVDFTRSYALDKLIAELERLNIARVLAAPEMPNAPLNISQQTDQNAKSYAVAKKGSVERSVPPRLTLVLALGGVVVIAGLVVALSSIFNVNNSHWTPRFEDFNDVTMALVPPGCFMMGSDPAKDPHTQPDEQTQFK